MGTHATPRQIARVRARAADGEHYNIIANVTGVSAAIVRLIVKRLHPYAGDEYAGGGIVAHARAGTYKAKPATFVDCCPVCASKRPRGVAAGAEWSQYGGHRCEHDEPCRGVRQAAPFASVCSLCEPAQRQVGT